MTVAFSLPMHAPPTPAPPNPFTRALSRFWPSVVVAAAPPAAPRGSMCRFWPAPARQRATHAPAPRASAPRKLRPGARPRSLGLRVLGDAERAQLRVDRAGLRHVYRTRPRAWGDCEGFTGPCPWVSCHHNLYLEVDDLTGAVKLNFPDKAVEELAETCSLRVAARGALSLEEVGKLVNLTQERVSQIEDDGLRKGRRFMSGARRVAPVVEELGDFVADVAVTPRGRR